MKMTLTAIATGLAFLAVQANAGGPVIIEDTTETVAPDRDRNVVPFIIAGAVILALIAGQSGNCVIEEVTPGPTPVPCD